MIWGDGESIDMFEAMAGLQIGGFLIFLVIGGGVAVFSHQFIPSVLPINGWSLLIGWILAAVVGYVVGGGFGAIIIMGGVFWLMSD